MIQRTRMIQKLRMHELFACVDSAVLEAALDGEAEFRIFQRGDSVPFGEASSENALFVLTGSIIRRKPENEHCAGRIPAGTLFALESLFYKDYCAFDTFTAAKESQVLFISKTAIDRLIQTAPDFDLGIIRFLSSRVFTLERRVMTYTGGNAQSRLARYLQEAFGSDDYFELSLSMQQLAILLDISRPSLYRAFSNLQESGAIQRDGKCIRLTNRDLLAQYISSDS